MFNNAGNNNQGANQNSQGNNLQNTTNQVQGSNQQQTTNNSTNNTGGNLFSNNNASNNTGAPSTNAAKDSYESNYKFTQSNLINLIKPSKNSLKNLRPISKIPMRN